MVLLFYLLSHLFYQQFLLLKTYRIQKKSQKRNKIQAASLYSEKSLLAQCLLLLDRSTIEIFLSSSLTDNKLLSSKSWFEVSEWETLGIFKPYLRARFWIENPSALERCGQKFFKITKTLFPRKTKKNKIATNSIFL